MSIPWALAVPVILFVGFVGPLWIVFHYVTVWKRMRTETAGPDEIVLPKADVERLRRTAGKLAERVDSLESLLDSEFPQWKTTIGDKPYE